MYIVNRLETSIYASKMVSISTPVNSGVFDDPTFSKLQLLQSLQLLDPCPSKRSVCIQLAHLLLGKMQFWPSPDLQSLGTSRVQRCVHGGDAEQRVVGALHFDGHPLGGAVDHQVPGSAAGPGREAGPLRRHPQVEVLLHVVEHWIGTD